MTKVKFCGMMREEDIKAVNELGPDYVGFIFAPKSRRYISPETAAAFKKMLRPDIKAVGVFVNADMKDILRLLDEGVIDMAQLHGSEDDEYIKTLKRSSGKAVIKAFGIGGRKDVLEAVSSPADIILLDTPGGGTGKGFDRKLIADLDIPYILAGGLTVDNVSSLITELHPFGVDVSSGIETDGAKDKDKMKAFMKEIRREAK
ncbi:MAG: phosphoribosylanthranilate isomerase [Clostridiales bacterium]|nr:phosphoribosylanthranilate isomerase [Clostridiales bacterium]